MKIIRSVPIVGPGAGALAVMLAAPGCYICWRVEDRTRR
jgi:hypothetical protein